MILSTLSEADRLFALHPLFAPAFKYLRDADLMALAVGRHTVQGEDIFAIVEHCSGRTRAQAKLESHRRYIDIQLVLEGVDEMGWKPLAECVKPVGEFDAAHAPLVSDGMIRKLVMKIAV